MASIFLAINIRYRNQRYIKMSSPYLNNMIIVGCILTYTSVILLGLDSELTSETSFPYICTARAWVLMAGFTLAFGSMFSKTWRVHSIFTDVQLNKKVIKDSQLFLVVFVLLCVDVAIMTTWQIVDPFYRETKKLTPYMRGDILVIPENEYCKSQKISVFVGCIYAYKGLLMVFGCFLAWETRLVSIPALNDSKYIGMSVYNVVIMCIIGVPISYILSDEQDASYLIISVFIIFCTTGTLCLVFVPKMLELRRNPQGTIDKRIVRSTLKPPKNPDSDSEMSDLHDQIKKAESDRQVFMRRLREREQELQLLIDQLGEEAMVEMEGHDHNRSTRRPSKPRSIERLRIEGSSRPPPPQHVLPTPCPSVTETTEATELTSLCSGTSQEAEYVPGRSGVSPVPSSLSTTTTSTTTTHHLQQHHHHHLHHYHHHQHHLPATGVVSACLSLDRAASRRGVTFASPLQTPRDVSKSVSFRLEGGGGGGCPATVEAIPLLHMNAPQQMPGPPPVSQPMVPPAGLPGNPYQEPMLEREGAAYGGYGGVYVHDYGGAMMQKEQNILQQRRASRTSLQGLRRYSRDEVDLGPPLEDAPPPPIMQEYGGGPLGEPPMGMGVTKPPVSHVDICPYRRTSLRQTNSAPKYSQVPRNLYSPLNNEDSGEKLPLMVGKKNSDIKIINNKANNNYQTLAEKNSNALANLAAGYNISGDGPVGYRGTQHQLPPQYRPQADQQVTRSIAVLRRGSEPPRPPGRGAMHTRNRSCDDLACSCCEVPLPHDLLVDHTSHSTSDAATDSDIDPREMSGSGRTRWETVDERDGTRTISRAHLRRDSFGEVVSRRSPSQDSLEQMRARSPTIMLDDPTPLATPTPPPQITHEILGRHSPSQDSFGYGVSRRSDSQDSLDRQVRNHAPLTQQTLPHARGHSHAHAGFMNGELSESAASSDDLNLVQSLEVYREPTSLHRTISEPYYNFDDDDDSPGQQRHLLRLQQQAQQQEQLIQQQQQQLRGNRARLPPVRTPSYDNAYDTSSLGGFSTHSLRGRSSHNRHATTTSVAAAIAAARKNASDNALDHDTSILPIFQKLLSERHRGYHGNARDFTMSSCPNITIKCDIVEYL
ncbi:uncharacterized protein LOC121863980 isoform X3 [Homarus americanus]|uniref:uncharacterized protein LOC121863980 isoform X3 n=1 Tax=Homarus americanus TaxID=6706 RepID=UPI001C491C61|nr:uncharacterized protein LOC121863980 isoform X3 [Homarus americanus]